MIALNALQAIQLAARCATSNPSSSGTVMTAHTGSSKQPAVRSLFLKLLVCNVMLLRHVCCLGFLAIFAITQQHSSSAAALKASTSIWHLSCWIWRGISTHHLPESAKLPWDSTEASCNRLKCSMQQRRLTCTLLGSTTCLQAAAAANIRTP
jgi:hypothetical protein